MSAPRPLLRFEHGWAHDAGVWAPLRAALADWPQQAADAGYFGPAVEPPPDGALRTRDTVYRDLYHFWSTVFAVNFGM
ncbi:hypothetical protein WLW83_20385, partial [Bordetella bronchiseptica]